MHKAANTSLSYTSGYRFLWFLIVLYVTVLLMSNWYDARIISIFGINTDAGTLIFPISFLCADIITEVYGYKRARMAIWCAFLLNMLFLLFGILIVNLPSPEFATSTNHAFDMIVSMNIWIIIASVVSYFCGEPLNALLVAKLKLRFQGKYMPVRFFLSTFIAAFIDSFIFSFIAFAHIFSIKTIITLAITMWLIKVCIELIGLPFSVYLSKRLKRAERTDIYDSDTQFSLFSLDDRYTKEANHYQ